MGGHKMLTFLGNLADNKVLFSCHVVKSTIPFLWSKRSMAKAGVVLNLPEDSALIMGKKVDLDLTSAGHYSLEILPKPHENVLLSLPEDTEELKVKLLKIHRQFGHPREDTMLKLLKSAKWDNEATRQEIRSIYSKCSTCKQFSKTPPRPIVSLPPASEFNEVLTMDLKEVNIKSYKYILHMIDAFTRLTVSVLIQNKRPETIVHNVMKNWVSVGYGRPKRIWTDMGGEFNNETMKQMAAALGCVVESTAGYAAWMNRLNERNHCVVDRCLFKILNDNPKMDPTIALAWAVTAKNSFPMNGGYSSFQLVFGKDPNLPNILTDKLPALEGVTTSQSIAGHINALYASTCR